MSFNEYWKAKAAKQRKAWAATAWRFADEHAQMEEIRKKVYTPLDYNNTFSFDGYKEDHLVEQNPIVKWDQMKCHFTENGLRNAMATEGADLANLTMLVSRESIVGVEAPCPQNRWEEFYIPNKACDYEKVYHAWLKRVYGICTDVETVSLTYGEVTMTIKRYSKEGAPFGYYELNPCEQLTKAAMMMQETDFNMLNVATLLMEMDATWKLRQEELNYYAKKLRLRTMEAAVATDEIEFTLWDDKKLAKKVEEYIAKEYTINQMIDQVLRPYKVALNKCFDAAVERSLRDEVPTLRNFNYISYRDNRDNFFEQELRPLLEAELDGVELEIKGGIDKTITITYHGCQCCLESFDSWLGIRLTPHVGYEKYTIPLSPSTPLSAIGGFVRQMPTINHRTDEYIVKALQIYDKLMCQQNEEYHAVVEHLGALATQHAGKPVGKLMKYLRWSAASLLLDKGCWRLDVSTIAVTGDTAFSYTKREVKGFLTTYEAELKEKWVDAECSNVYSADPKTTDANEWNKANNEKQFFQREEWWSLGVRSFVGYGNDDTFLSVEFIHEKL